jgi:diketogulonate reductase-like aldo/keto reductase
MTVLQENFVLDDGIAIPKIGFGTWQIPNDDAASAVTMALENGYRHIDTAAVYGNEKGVGEAIRKSGISRAEMFITTKIPAECMTFEGARDYIEQSLANLGTPYIDLMLIHAPKPWPEMFTDTAPNYYEEKIAVYKAMEEAHAAGLIKTLGVSNFDVADLENILNNCSVAPTINQIRYHVGHTQDAIVTFCKENDILVEGYSPIATGKLLDDEVLASIAAKYDKSVAQLCIRYVLQNGLLPLPKSTHKNYIIDNAAIDFEISADDMLVLDTIKQDR